MARLVSVSAALALIAIVATAGHAAAPYGKVVCSTKSASFVFWPNGHGKLKEPGFGKYTTPHLEVYAGLRTTNFPSKTTIYAEPAGAAPGSNCNAIAAAPLTGKVQNAAKRTKAANIQCRFGQKLRAAFTKVRGGQLLSAVLKDGTRVVDAKIVKSGSTITFDTKRCKAKPPPK